MVEGKLKVVLLACTKDPEKIIVSAIRQCYSSIGASELTKKTSLEKQKELIKMVISSGHVSTLEHANFTFAIEGISRACSHQLVRHRVASYSQQSQRYVDFSKKGISYIVPPRIKTNKDLLEVYNCLISKSEEVYQELIKKGVDPEDARFILPNAAETKIVVTMNARELLHFFELRLCNRAQWEIVCLAQAMLKVVKKTAPTIFSLAGATCTTKKICWEGSKSCGKWKQINGSQIMQRENG